MSIPKFPLNSLPPTVDLTLYLIREELKSQRFFNILSKAGIEDVYYKPRLGKAILMTMEMDDGKDETFELYYALIEKRVTKIEMDAEIIKTQAAAVFLELLIEKRKRQNLK
jgi:L-asparaginase II